jgi:hypothetical protein
MYHLDANTARAVIFDCSQITTTMGREWLTIRSRFGATAVSAIANGRDVI